MKIFVAGATGAVGRPLVPALLARRHEVVGLTRSADKADALRAAGAEAVIADALDRSAMLRAVREVRPDIIIHQLTGLAGVTNYRNFDREFALTNRLRTEGTEILLEAGRHVGVRRFIAQSYGGWNYERSGDVLKAEADRFDPHPPRLQKQTLAAIQQLEHAVLNEPSVTGIALRFGSLYGPGTNIATGGDVAALVRARKLPIVGNGAGIWSFLHIDDAASAIVAAIKYGNTGVYNICDDEPAPVRDWLPALAQALGAPPPRHVPSWLGRLAAGEVGVSMMTKIRGVANAKAKRELQWQPKYASWRQGFREGL